jgi:hypothetical protein
MTKQFDEILDKLFFFVLLEIFVFFQIFIVLVLLQSVGVIK